MSARLIAGIVAGICGTFFLGYCVYFDRKRRSDPLFKQKLLEKRRKAKQAQQEASMEELRTGIPDKRDAAAVQQFFMEEVQKGEELLALGEFEQAVSHLTKAVAVCNHPQQLLQLFHGTLPDHVFQLLIERLNDMSPSQQVQSSDGGDSLD
ncbi:mitochondrial import receptor subunit TOM20 homolog [Montipora capricornis]|uniref:mitochondrial import receptor subunit TOM20 homolog n=1 Tax=Montipora foliosa TaxID=591990 RepID=UPI0035F1E3EC